MRLAILFLFVVVAVDGIAFDQQHALFGVARGGGKKKEPTPVEEHQRAQDTILKAISSVEDSVHKAVETEVNTLFHELPPHEKAKAHAKAKKAVEKGAQKAKKHVHEHDDQTAFPYEIHNPYGWTPKPHVEHKDYRILQAVESAEKAVLHAIQDEVDTLFHESPEHEKAQAEKTRGAVQKGVQKTDKKVQKTREHRRGWLTGEGVSAGLEEYVQWDFE